MEPILLESIQEKSAEIADMMKQRLSIRGKDLAAKLRHSGRMLPKRIKYDAEYLVEATAMAQSPKLYKMIDMERVDTAHHNCIEFLKTIDVTDRRKGLVLGILGSMTMSVIIVIALVIGVLIWRDLL